MVKAVTTQLPAAYSHTAHAPRFWALGAVLHVHEQDVTRTGVGERRGQRQATGAELVPKASAEERALTLSFR